MKQVDNKVKAVIREEVIARILAERSWKYDDLLFQLKKEYGIGIGYKSFAKMLRNKTSWQLTYAFAMCDFLSLELRELFQLVENSDL